MSLNRGWLEVQKCQREGKQEKGNRKGEVGEIRDFILPRKLTGESLWSRACAGDSVVGGGNGQVHTPQRMSERGRQMIG